MKRSNRREKRRGRWNDRAEREKTTPPTLAASLKIRLQAHAAVTDEGEE